MYQYYNYQRTLYLLIKQNKYIEKKLYFVNINKCKSIIKYKTGRKHFSFTFLYCYKCIK